MKVSGATDPDGDRDVNTPIKHTSQGDTSAAINAHNDAIMISHSEP